MQKRTSFLGGMTAVLALCCLGSISAQGATYYVRAGAAGSGNGSDWNNAYPSLPATLVRGATYYVGGGSYPTYTFNTALSGTSVVTVKKASPTDHGTDTGWAASYGTMQAVFASQINVYKGYFVLDGQYRNEGDWFDGASYGFKIANNGTWQNLIIRDPSGNVTCPNVTIKYLYIAAIVGQLPASSGTRPYAIDTDTYSSTIRNPGYVFSRVFVEGSNNPFFVRNTINPLVEYCASSKTSGSSTFHGEIVNLFYSDSGGGTVRYNYFKDCYNGASGYPKGGGTGVIAICNTSGAQIYGNIFESYYVGDGAIAAGWENYNIKVFNNTFVNGDAASKAVHFTVSTLSASGNEAYNNLCVSCGNTGYDGKGAFGNNYTDSTSVFVNYTGHDYRLARATQAGRTFSSPYNIDKAGNLRGADGLWDVGAYEFGAVSDTTRPTVTLTAPANGAVVSNTVTISASASDNVGVSGVKFFVNATQVADVTASPFAYSWNTTSVSNGIYKFSAQARDAAGNTAWAATNSVTVNNAPAAPPAPAAYWTFDEGAGTTATDSVSANSLTLRTGAGWTSAGKFGTALTLDGTSGRADAPNSSSLSPSGGSMSVAAWVNLQDQGTWQQIVSKPSQVGSFAAPYYAWHLFGAGASSTQWRPQFQLVNSSGTSVNVSSAVNVNYSQWVHVVGVYDGAAVRIYVNGVEQGSAAQSGNIMSYSLPLYIGASGLPGEFAKGSIDEVKIYSQALSAAQVSALFSSTVSNSRPPAPTGLRVVVAN